MSAKMPPGYGGFYKPGGHRQQVMPPGKNPNMPTNVKEVVCTQFFFLNLDVPFTSSAGETVQAGSFIEQFPMLVRGAWTDLTDVRVQLTQNVTGEFFSQFQVPILGWAGNSDKVFPLYWWKKPLFLGQNAQIRGNFINDGGEAAGQMVFFCERPDLNFKIQYHETREYRLLLDLGLDGVLNSTGMANTQQIEYDLLIWGMTSTSTGVEVIFKDTSANQDWSADQLPIGAYAGLTTEVQPIVKYPVPYFLPRNSTIQAKFTNAGTETGKAIEFICERIVY